ncbi:pentapeptide repeat-containing protein [Paracoccus sp. MBLB3053]|uniref:Pentapeptide repeat-containing protein n=1 Tax=Paracoccus aurantius TaxID=3073814 RepID=A0ABU2HSM1_9RHOB|nr:pentapeptide repeat-containing protein [Paracoccus sp. MBLB3053]MDS9468041.1 pentapeptide repeat-containing protein [Paracoccus sp. MBLB3053]
MTEHSREEILRRIVATGQVHLARADLAGLDLSGLTLVDADLSYADLTGADLSDAELSGASLWSAKAKGAKFCRANLSGANLGLAVLDGADMHDAILDHADLTGTQLKDTDLSGSQMQGVWLDAMQRALAIGAPTLQFPSRTNAPIRVLDERAPAEVLLHRGERLELRLTQPARQVTIRQDEVSGRPVLRGPEPQGGNGEVLVLRFSAAEPGQARLLVARDEGEPALSFDVQVVP